MINVLLVTENELSNADVWALTTRSGATAADFVFYVTVPAQRSTGTVEALMDDYEMDAAAGRGQNAVGSNPEVQANPADVAESSAELTLQRSLGLLREAGSTADGEVTPVHPLDTIKDLLEARHVDEVVLMTHRQWLREAVHADLGARIRAAYDVPVLRVEPHSG